jgi:CheY-like chemotaxis protein
MPQTDGFSLAGWIKKQGFSDLRVVMMLTFPRLKRKNEFEQLGIAAGVVKPPGRSELYETILEALAVKRHRPQMVSATRKHAPPKPARSLKVLVAEDTPFNQKFIMRLLERWQHRATLVEDGTQVLKALKKDRFDIVLMDVQMPEMDGLEATRAIRAGEQASGGHIPIVAMTAHAVKGDLERCLEAGMDEYVSKPIDADKLFNIVETLVRQPAAAAKDAGATVELNREMLLAAFDHDWDFFSEVVEVFFEDYPRLLSNLEQCFEQNDSDGLMRAAHSLKGMLRNFQADNAAEIAFELEKMGKTGQLEGVKTGIGELSRHLAAIEKQLRHLLENKDKG